MKHIKLSKNETIQKAVLLLRYGTVYPAYGMSTQISRAKVAKLLRLRESTVEQICYRAETEAYS